jgi:catalase-peroxidase
VLAGNVGVEQAAAAAGVDVTVPFTPGRTDATIEQTDVESFAVLEPKYDGFRNYIAADNVHTLPGEYLLLDKANQLTLSAPEMTVLVGGLRVLQPDFGASSVGVLTGRPGALTNDFFVTLLDLGTSWTPADAASTSFNGVTADGTSYVGSRVDLVFGSNAELRAVAEVYASAGSEAKFVADFVAAWTKVMELGRY